MRSVLLYNPSKTQWKNEPSYSWYAVKNTYNPVEQIRRNTFGIYHVFHISLIKTVMGKIKEIDINLCAHCFVKNLLWQTIL
jgi:hypothetical protein